MRTTGARYHVPNHREIQRALRLHIEIVLETAPKWRRNALIEEAQDIAGRLHRMARRGGHHTAPGKLTQERRGQR